MRTFAGHRRVLSHGHAHGIREAWFDFSFINGREGWLFRPGAYPRQCSDASAEFWHTTDGAATWQKVVIESWTESSKSDTAQKDSSCKSGLSFTDPQHGYISAAATGRQPTIYRTADGGKRWAGVDLPDPPDYITSSTIGGFQLRASSVKRFGKALYVQASGGQPGDSPYRSYVFRSTDGGATWSSMTKILSTYSVVVVTSTRWLMLYVPGVSMESTTSGSEWHTYPSDFNAATRVVFGDSRVGYADAYGALLRTVDGGLHWERISAPGFPKLDLLPVTDPSFKCRLPVVSSVLVGPWNGGFVGIPRGPFGSDEAAHMVFMRGEGWYETPAQPVLKGDSGLSFDAPFSRWVPARSETLTDDGSLYVWAEHDYLWNPASAARTAPKPDRIHITRVADGMDRSFAVVPTEPRGPAIPVPLGITKDGSVLLTVGWEGSWGVWRLDPANGSVTKISAIPSPRFGAGAIWGTPQLGPNPAGMYSDGDTLTRLDLKTGAVRDWYHRDGVVIRPLGFDLDGSPWVEAITFGRTAGPEVREIWRVRAPGQADLVFSGQRFSRVTSDSHGTWFANETGVYLFAGGRVQRVSAASIGEVVGPCV